MKKLATTSLLALLVVSNTVMYFAASSFLSKRLRSRALTDESISLGFRALVVIRSALIEAAGLFGAIIYLVTATEIVLVMPVAAAVLLIAQLPTRARFDAFCADLRA